MKAPSPLQIAVLMFCGSLLACFSCFYTADNMSSVLGALGYALGLATLAYAAVGVIRRRTAVAPAVPPPGPDLVASAPQPEAVPPGPVPPGPRQVGPTAGQGVALVVCGFLLFFFSCGGAIIPVRGADVTLLASVGIPGMMAGAVFMLWGAVRFVLGLSSRRKRQ